MIAFAIAMALIVVIPVILVLPFLKWFWVSIFSGIEGLLEKWRNGKKPMKGTETQSESRENSESGSPERMREMLRKEGFSEKQINQIMIDLYMKK